MKRILFLCVALLSMQLSYSQKDVRIKKKDRKKDILIQTTSGNMIVRLSDLTPLHRDNFIKLVKQHYFDSILFHRVINKFMIQAGDPESKGAAKGKPLGNGGPEYNVPAEFHPSLFHQKGVIAAARESDDVNPKKESSGSQFYIVQGKTFTDGALDTLEVKRLKRKIPVEQREVYKTIGGTPQLDQNYTVFGQVVSGLNVIDKIAVVETSKGIDRDRPIEDVMIIHAKLVKRKKL